MRRILLTCLAVTTAVLTACGSDSSTAPTQASVAGTWNLATINGSPLPYVAQAANPKIELMSDQLVAGANGTFSQTTVVRVTNGTSVTTQSSTDAGTYSLNGTAVTFVFSSDSSSGTATLSGGTMTVAESGYSWVYKKQ